MNLFKVHKKVQEHAVIDNNVITPLGTIILNINIDNQCVNYNFKGKKYKITNKSNLTRWENNNLEVELLVNEPEIKLADHMEVEKCIAAIWRFRFNSNTSKVFIELKFLDEDLSFESYGLEPGEDLYSIGFETKDYKLHIGTRDEEVLVYRREENDYFPIGIPNDGKYYYPFVDSNKGIGILLDSIEIGEICQVHFVISWAKYKKWDRSTWFAVDSKTKELLPDCVEY